MGWVLTLGLQNLREQVGKAFPDRDKTSDGTVGDLAHQLEKSDHNPDRTGNAAYKDGDALDEVRAWDMDSDLRSAAGVDAQELVDHLRALPGVHTVLRYMIYNRKIYQADTGWQVEPYTGPSAHTEHIHFSGQRTQAADSNTTFDFRLEELTMDEASISARVRDDLRKSLDNLSDSERNRAASAALKIFGPRLDAQDKAIAALASGIADVSKAVAAISTQVNAIKLGGVDVNALAAAVTKAVNDDAAKRMQQ